MKRQPSIELIRGAQAIAEALGCPGASFTITMPYVCDHCQDDSKQAFPYGVYDRHGHYWKDLCNDCFDLLGCGTSDEDYW